MKYIGQIFTGGWNNRNYSAEEIIERLEKVSEIIKLEKVIIGWNTEKETYIRTGRWLHEHGIRMLLWLPVFSETGELKEADEAIDLSGCRTGNLALQEGENFTFYCPSDERIVRNVIGIYEEFFSECGFDGVFLDKIRTQSAVGGKSGILSCCCERCEKEYAKFGLSLQELREAYETEKDHLFDVSGYEDGEGFIFAKKEMEMFLDAKSLLIADSVNRICRYFRSKNLETGLDLYAPLLSKTVGQNYALISRDADFIKPMMYRKTEAPAGIGYEYELLKNAAGNADGYPDIRMDAEFLRQQLKEFSSLKVAKYPGIEINYREDIARTDPEYIMESLEICKECGMDGAVLAWDIMMAPDSHLAAVAEALCTQD